MTISRQVATNAEKSSGTVIGAPRLWLQFEGFTLLIGSLVAFCTTHRSWWLVPLVIFLPDFLMLGYMAATRIGAHVYNFAHATPIPALMVGAAWWQGNSLWLAQAQFGLLTSGWIACSNMASSTTITSNIRISTP